MLTRRGQEDEEGNRKIKKKKKRGYKGLILYLFDTELWCDGLGSSRKCQVVLPFHDFPLIPSQDSFHISLGSLRYSNLFM